jgi:hypothetical protein
MERRFNEASALADTVAEMISKLKQHGVDTAKLERALENFRSRMADAHSQWEKARDVLVAHAGFDAEGHVTDARQARTTVTEAHLRLQRARMLIERAARDLRAVMASYPRPAR